MTRVVLLGLKGHQGVCLSEIAQRPDVHLVAVTDDEPALLKGAAKLPGARPDTLITPNLDEVMALRDIDVAILAGDNGSRAAQLLACARRGWHLCSEKPLTLTLADLDKLRAVLAETKVHLTMLLTMRFEPIYRAMRAAILGGAIGTPLLLSGQKSYRRGNRPAWQRDPATYGGTIPFIGIHPLDLLHFVTGCTYGPLVARHHNAGLPGAGRMEETCVLLGETTTGALVDVRLDYLRPEKATSHGDDRLRVAGSTGVIEVLDGKLSLLTNDAPLKLLPTEPAPNLFGQFLDSLAGRATHDISAEECLSITEVVLRAWESAKRG